MAKRIESFFILCILALIALVILLTGCSRKKPVVLNKKNVASITYNTKFCHELPDMRISCNQVIFTRKTVSVEELKEKRQ